MRVLVIEDENSVAQNLCDILQEIDESIEILTILESVQEAVTWLNDNPKPDLGFFDIRLADGDSFEIFEQAEVNFPIIFTSAYDEYALKAFKVNSVDYLVKPIDRDALQSALNKYKAIYTNKDQNSKLLPTSGNQKKSNTKRAYWYM